MFPGESHGDGMSGKIIREEDIDDVNQSHMMESRWRLSKSNEGILLIVIAQYILARKLLLRCD